MCSLLVRVSILGFLGLSACGGSRFRGSSPRFSSSMSQPAHAVDAGEAGMIEVPVVFSEGEEMIESMGLVQRALSSYKAQLEGGVSCWGDQQVSFEGSSANLLKVRKGAVGCKVVFKELRLKEADPEIVFKNDLGLEGALDKEASFKNEIAGQPHRNMAVKVLSGLNTAAASELKLMGRMVVVAATETTVTEQTVAVSAGGDVAAAPHVAVKSLGKFNDKLYLTLKCVENGVVALKCKPDVDAQAGGVAGEQAFAAMKVAAVKISGDDVTHFPGSMSHARVKALMDAASPTAPTLPAVGFESDFNGLSYSAPGAEQKVILIVRFSEVVAGATYESFKVFGVAGL